jgi:hypothetical protein
VASPEVASPSFQALGIFPRSNDIRRENFGSQSPRDAKDSIDKPSHLGRSASFDQKTCLKRRPFA